MDLLEHFQRHLKFIEASCVAYDQGDTYEALRIAVSLRVLFHDTAKSTSLLEHLGEKINIELLSTIGCGKSAENISGFFIFLPLMMSMDGVKPPLGEGPPPRLLKFAEWWNEVILAQNHKFSRRDVILSAANQDGGAHVDMTPTPKTLELKSGVGTFTRTMGDQSISEELTNHHFPLLRQMAYEVLNSRLIDLNR